MFDKDYDEDCDKDSQAIPKHQDRRGIRPKRLTRWVIGACLPLVALAITRAFPVSLRTYHPTYIKQFVFQSATLLVLGISLAWVNRGALSRLTAALAEPSARSFLLAFLVLCLISPLWSPAPNVSLRAALDALLYVVWAILISCWTSDRGELAGVVKAVIAAAALATVWALVQFLGPALSDPGVLEDPGYRLMLPLGNPNFMAGLANIGLLSALSYSLTVQTPFGYRLVAAAGVLVMGIAGLCTRSLAGLVGLPSGLAVLVLLWVPRRLAQRGLLLLVILGLVLTSVLARPSSSLADRLVALAMKPGSTNHARPFLWMAAVDMIRGRPVLGRGMGAFLLAHPQFRPPAANLYRWGRDEHFDIHPHNEWLDVAVEVGLLGLILYVLVIVCACGNAWRWLAVNRGNPDAWAVQAALAGVVTLQVQAMFGVGLRYWDLAPFYWALIGVLLATRPIDLPPADTQPHASRPWIRWGGSVVCIALWLALPVRGYAAQVLTLRARRAERHDVAAGHYLRAMELASYYVDAVRLRVMLAKAYLRGRDSQAQQMALESYKAADALAPGFERSKLHIAALYRRQGRDKEAVRWLETYVQQNPHLPIAWLELSKAREAIGDREAQRRRWPPAATAYRRAFRDAPTNLHAAAKLALAEAQSGHGAEARRWLRWLGLRDIRTEDLRETIRQAERAVSGP